MLRITKTAEGYSAEATPPHTSIDYTSFVALGPLELIRDLGSAGATASDISNALSKADPYWNSETPTVDIPPESKELSVGD